MFLHCHGLLGQGLWWGGTYQLFGHLVPIGDSQVGELSCWDELGEGETRKISVL